MRVLEETKKYRVDTEDEAIAAIQLFRDKADQNGYVVSKSTYQKKEKKAKGEILDSGYLVSITIVYAHFWDLGD